MVLFEKKIQLFFVNFTRTKTLLTLQELQFLTLIFFLFLAGPEDLPSHETKTNGFLKYNGHTQDALTNGKSAN